MIDFSGKTKAALLAEMLGMIPDTYDKRDMSPINTALAPAAWALEGVYIVLAQMQKQAFLETATGDDLNLIAALGGISRLAATPAVRLGEFNTSINLGDRFSTINGADSINFRATAATSDPTKWWLTAETAGTIGNTYVGPILPITSIAGLTSAQITDIIVDGSDEETDSELRSRLVTALTDRPFAGNIASYRKMLLEMTEAGGTAVKLGAVQVYPTWDGGGTVKCSVLGADYLPITNELLALIQDEVDPTLNAGEGTGLAPIGAEVTIDTGTEIDIDVTATVAHTSSTTISSLEPLISAAIEAYLEEVRSEWGTPDPTDITVYTGAIYISRITAAILSVPGVTNVTGVTVNSSSSDLTLTESSAVQQVPVLGDVIITEA